ncbi:MAG: hypothetical protein WBO24_20885 [Nitrospirales bacterium]
MQPFKTSLILSALIMMCLCLSISTAFALDPNTGIQDRYSSPSKGQILSPSGREPVTKKQPTTEQKFNLLFSKMAKLEQTVATLQNQVTVQAQHIAQLRQIIAVNSSGVVTIQAPGTLNINAGGNLNMSGSTLDIKAAIAGVHGILKADTLMTTTVIAKSYTPGAGNIW